MVVFGAAGCSSEGGHGVVLPTGSAAAVSTVNVKVVARALTIPTFPCRQCHDFIEPNATPRALKAYHTTIVLKHSPSVGWCKNCHQLDDFNSLHLADGTKISFDESYRICGQCHGEKLRDWKAGIHGLLTGSWRDIKKQLTCTACHSPHAPRFPRLEPMPPPLRPRGYEPPSSGRGHGAPKSGTTDRQPKHQPKH